MWNDLEAVSGGGDPRDLDLARRQIQKEENDKPLEPLARPDFHREEIGRHDQLPMSREELFPGRFAAPVQGHAVPESMQWCCGPACIPNEIKHLVDAGNPNHGSLPLSE